jgi:hypothetical protein
MMPAAVCQSVILKLFDPSPTEYHRGYDPMFDARENSWRTVGNASAAIVGPRVCVGCAIWLGWAIIGPFFRSRTQLRSRTNL